MAANRASPKFNVLTASVTDLQVELASRKLSSVEVVTAYFAQIDQHNTRGLKLRALISVISRDLALQQAQELDNERREKGSRGPFHGIPVIVKDTFWTDPSLGMDTTCGSGALSGARGPRNAVVVDTVDFDAWLPAPHVVEPAEEFWKQTREAIEIAAARIRDAGGRVRRDVPLVTMPELKVMEKRGGVDTDDVFGHNFKASIDAFLSGYRESPVRSLQEMVEYNRTHADVCLPPDHPSQAVLEAALTTNPDPDFEKKLAVTRHLAQTSIDKLLDDQNLDVVMGFGDGRISSVAALAGYAVGSLPLGFADFNGRAFGVHAIPGRNGERKLLEIMSAWEKSFPEGRMAPPMMGAKH
ncbi:amidase signature enzyme [Lophiostoma macrostomum CBS 122681]|uniref:Amidase signature enzyme n=1 Tax=Lophiostoma macrostomum CBS 122681 TaxID=1314788 RepID=A0A6A6TNK0_9PLEO|nr:amidase signature enzyme [Lophiostoma macrostomum CBS 122681]